MTWRDTSEVCRPEDFRATRFQRSGQTREFDRDFERRLYSIHLPFAKRPSGSHPVAADHVGKRAVSSVG